MSNCVRKYASIICGGGGGGAGEVEIIILVYIYLLTAPPLIFFMDFC